MAFRSCQVVTNIDKWKELVKSKGLSPVPINQTLFTSAYNMYLADTSVRSSVETRNRQLTSIDLLVGKKALTGLERKELLGDWQMSAIKKSIRDCEVCLFLYGICFITENKDGPHVLDPRYMDIMFGDTVDGERVYYVSPRSPGAVGTMGVGATGMLDSSFVPRVGVKRKRGESDRLMSEDDDDEPRSKRRNEYNIVMMIEEQSPDPTTGVLQTQVVALVKRESMRNAFEKCAVDSANRMANPPLHTVSITPTPVQQQNQMAYAVPGDTAAIARDAMSDSAARARAASQQRQALMLSNAKMMEENQRLTAQSLSSQTDVNKRPIAGSSTLITPTQPIEDGRTGFIGPRSEPPPNLMDFLLYTSNEIGRATGVPAVLTGDMVHAHAIQQTTMYVFGATLAQRRDVCSEIISLLFRVFRGSILLGWLERKTSQKDKKITKGELHDATEGSVVTASFSGLMDPVTTERFWEIGAISAQTYIKCASSYSGLPPNDFDEKALEVRREMDVRMYKANVVAAETAVTLAKKESTAPDSKPSAPKKPKKEEDFKRKEDKSLSVKRAGPMLRSGAASSKTRDPTPRKSKAA